jgi:hypothetical protein
LGHYPLGLEQSVSYAHLLFVFKHKVIAQFTTNTQIKPIISRHKNGPRDASEAVLSL